MVIAILEKSDTLYKEVNEYLKDKTYKNIYLI